MRKLFAILLLAATSLALAAPLFALGGDSEAGVPICCRKNGLHHCLMTAGDSPDPAQGPGARLSILKTRCPYAPASVPSPAQRAVALPASSPTFAPLLTHPRGIPQTQSRLRIARERTRNKRGPPTLPA